MMKISLLLVAALAALSSIHAFPQPDVETHTYTFRIPGGQNSHVTVKDQQGGTSYSITFILNHLPQDGRVKPQQIPGGHINGTIDLTGLKGNTRGTLNVSSLIGQDGYINVKLLRMLLMRIINEQQGGGQPNQPQPNNGDSGKGLKIILNFLNNKSDKDNVNVDSIPGKVKGESKIDLTVIGGTGEIDLSSIVNGGKVNVGKLKQLVNQKAAENCQEGLITRAKNSLQNGLTKGTGDVANIINGAAGNGPINNVGRAGQAVIDSVLKGSGNIIEHTSCGISNAYNDALKEVQEGNPLAGATDIVKDLGQAAGNDVTDKLNEITGGIGGGLKALGGNGDNNNGGGGAGGLIGGLFG